MIPSTHAISGMPPLDREDPLKELAVQLEANFLAEMLKSAGVGKVRDGLGGGIGEEQFSSFVVENHAKTLAKSGEIGLAESIFRSLKGYANGD